MAHTARAYCPAIGVPSKVWRPRSKCFRAVSRPPFVRAASATSQPVRSIPRQHTSAKRWRSQRNPFAPVTRVRPYFTDTTPPEAPYPPTESAILSAAATHIPVHGFTTHALTLGAIDAGYLPASVNLFQRGAFDLVLYHLITSRLGLKDSVQFPERAPSQGQRPLSIADKTRTLLVSRLRTNQPIVHKLPEAFALMSLPTNIPSSLRELAMLADEILYLSGDTDVSGSWYTKRAALSGVYASSEIFMMQDQSKDFEETEKFVERRLDDSDQVAYATGSIGQWVGFTGLSAVNVLRSWGMRI